MRFSQHKNHPEISNNTQLCALSLYFLEDSIPDLQDGKEATLLFTYYYFGPKRDSHDQWSNFYNT